MSASDVKTKIRTFFDADFDKNTLHKIDYDKSTYLYAKLFFIAVIVVMVAIGIRIFIFPSLQENKNQGEIDGLQQEITALKEENKELKVKLDPSKNGMADIEKERDSIKKFETSLNDILSQKDLSKWKDTEVSVGIGGKPFNTKISTITLLLTKSSEESKNASVKLLKVGASKEDMTILLRDLGSIDFWKNYFINREMLSRKGSSTDVKDLIK